MWHEFETLQNRILAILGADTVGDIFVRHVDIWSGTAAMEVAIRFDEDQIPPNMLKTRKDVLTFDLDVPNFDLELVKLSEKRNVGRIYEISDRHLHVGIGDYLFKFDAQSIHFGNFRLGRYAELIDMNWT